MNQKKIGTTLYVFSETPYQITQDTDASVICIQEECIPGYAALNESLVSKFKAYNYHLFCVQKPEWADYYDDNVVIINSMTHGSVTANPMSADPGEEITLTVTPAENYELQTLTVTDADDNPVTVTNNKFEMPEGNAYVSATFIGMEFDITVTAASNGTVTTSPANGARLGDTVTITMTPAEGYEVDTLTVISGAATITVTNNQFTMPAGDVTVTGTFKQSGTVIHPKWYKAYGGEEITSPYTVYSQDHYELDLYDTTLNIGVTDNVSGYTGIVATWESSDSSVITIGSSTSTALMMVAANTAGTATVTATWPAQTVDNVMYAGGSASITINVES